jgi:rhamnulokinase
VSSRPLSAVTGIFVAADLGASSGRVMTGVVSDGEVRLEETHRFPNVPLWMRGTLHWDVLRLFDGVLAGIRCAGRGSRITSIAIDGWAVDYALLDSSGRLLGNPVHYRDGRAEAAIPHVHATVPPAELYARTGIQFLPFNTIYQLASELETSQLREASTLLLIPDLFTYWLTGDIGVERTNASTTQLLTARSRDWDVDLMRRLGIPRRLFPPLVDPGADRGSLSAEIVDTTGLQETVPVVTVGSHDTASAVAAVPARGNRFAYIATGTWSLVGVELAEPLLTEQSRAANFTNELGLDGTVRYLRNVMGLWVLQECMRTWREEGHDLDLELLLGRAAQAASLAAVVDVDDPTLIPTGNMPARIAEMCRRTGQVPPLGPPATVRCILDSLALAHRAAVSDAVRISGHEVEVVHVVGGGARNTLLCQLTADACGLPVEAGPVEAAALGNVLVQARAAGLIHGGLRELRDIVRRSELVSRYEPRGKQSAWNGAAARIGRTYR